MEILGCDLFNGNSKLKIADLKKSGYHFAILRGGYTGYGLLRTKNKDKSFESFYKQAKECGMPIGVYWYSCCTNEKTGRQEAEYLYKNCLKGKQFEYPIYIDIEDTHWQLKNKTGVTDGIIAFCSTLEKLGYWVGVYSNPDWFDNHIETNRLTKYTKWVARYTTQKPAFKYNAFDMWQYGIEQFKKQDIDGNKCFRDFPTLIKNKGKNGYDKKDITTIAKEVIDGKWGVGEDRKKRLTDAGYDYTEVQKKVNELIAIMDALK